METEKRKPDLQAFLDRFPRLPKDYQVAIVPMAQSFQDIKDRYGIESTWPTFMVELMTLVDKGRESNDKASEVLCGIFCLAAAITTVHADRLEDLKAVAAAVE